MEATPDPLSADDEDAQFVREQWIKEQMQSRVGDFTEPTPVKIFCGTYNLHAKHHLENVSEFTEWLCPFGAAEADLYALSFQEIVKLNAMNVTVDTKGEKVCSIWETTIMNSLNERAGSGGRFVHVASKQLVGAFLCVFLRERLLLHCSDVRTAVTATGIMDIMGNKGGVVIRMKLHHSTLCFVGGHLAAKRDNVEGRNSDYHSITNKTCLYPSLARKDTNQISEAAVATETAERPLLLQAADRLAPPYMRILDHDLVFWIGDLNYRIESSLSLEEVISKCAESDISYLREHDQLNIERKAGKVFQGFEEGDLNFLPTYKFIPGTDEYDNRPDKKLRPPAWCDRVLWRVRDPAPATVENHMSSTDEAPDLLDLELTATATGDSEYAPPSGLLTVAQELRSPVEVLRREVEKSGVSSAHAPADHYVRQLSYGRSLAPRISDHKPVSALFDYFLRILDKMENAGVPKLDVKGLDINAGLVQFKVPHVSTVRLLNIGFSAVRWKLAPKPGSRFVCPPWMRVSPTMGMIAPGQATEISVSVLFDPTAVKSIDHEAVRQISFLGLSEEIMRELNAIPEQIFNDVLILRVRNGRDFFISVSASYKINGDDFAEMGLEEAGQCDSDSEPPEERRSLRDRSLSAEAVAVQPVKKVDKWREAATVAASKLKTKGDELKAKSKGPKQEIPDESR